MRIGARDDDQRAAPQPRASARLRRCWSRPADHFASEQMRNAATLGGNVCNASPAGDMLPPLLVLGAAVELAPCSARRAVQTRRMPLERFFIGPGKTVKLPRRAADRHRVPPACRRGFVGRFCKSGPRPALDISAISIGLRRSCRRDGSAAAACASRSGRWRRRRCAPAMPRLRSKARRSTPRPIAAAVASDGRRCQADRRRARQCVVSPRSCSCKLEEVLNDVRAKLKSASPSTAVETRLKRAAST